MKSSIKKSLNDAKDLTSHSVMQYDIALNPDSKQANMHCISTSLK
jgi:hypothetical protein